MAASQTNYLGYTAKKELATILGGLLPLIEGSSDSKERYIPFIYFPLIFNLPSVLLINLFVFILIVVLNCLLLVVCYFQ